MGVNQVFLLGRLLGPPQYQQSTRGNTFATLLIETENRFTGANGPQVIRDKFEVSVSGKSLESLPPGLQPGSLLVISGKLSGREWRGQDGRQPPKYFVDVKAMSVELAAASPQGPAQQAPQQPQQYGPPQQQPQQYGHPPQHNPSAPQPQYGQPPQQQPPQYGGQNDYGPPPV